ncbi:MULTISPECIES: TVP38/TMEM64 family protein [Haloarcula]|uniref:TVP38/TMEM64 family protein n=1 Tax=Haloarcula pellucida TaxID=1427151 RepID=A0A830GPW0_9EURY|nr:MULTISPECIES: VTT domain-containing protein [Halomicroarcula]MBX0348265.1 VTT domain-containing protein [Halomicroarcula pellucida]MDS0278090.1 VTT domain-containing protein [Halomicroarcula sp. S1AR25-4]GGN97761.1 TVP38/TMEM64 family protein [Halomicroarcula pellucida]
MDRLVKRQVVGSAALLAAVAVAALVLSPAHIIREAMHLADHPVYLAGLIVALYLVRPLFAWPTMPLSAFVGFVLGVEWGFPVALMGALVTCLIPYRFARKAGEQGGMFGWLGESGQRIMSVTGETRGVLAARLSPVPADPVSYGAGFADVSTRAFVVGTFLGEIPWVAVEVIAGASMRSLTLTGLSIEALPHLLSLFGAMAVLVLAGPTYRHFSGRPESS